MDAILDGLQSLTKSVLRKVIKRLYYPLEGMTGGECQNFCVWGGFRNLALDKFYSNPDPCQAAGSPPHFAPHGQGA